MVKNGVVRRSIITIDLSKLSYEGKVFLLITNAPNNGKAKTIEALKKIKTLSQ